MSCIDAKCSRIHGESDTYCHHSFNWQVYDLTPTEWEKRVKSFEKTFSIPLCDLKKFGTQFGNEGNYSIISSAVEGMEFEVNQFSIRNTQFNLYSIFYARGF